MSLKETAPGITFTGFLEGYFFLKIREDRGLDEAR